MVKDAERMVGDPEEVIRIQGLSANDTSRLQKLGIDTKAPLTRARLLEKGITFLNKYGDGEKALIKGYTFMMEGAAVDSGTLSFLTRDQLNEVAAFQTAHPEVYATQGIPLDVVRADMYRFMLLTDVINQTGPSPDRQTAMTFAYQAVETHIEEPKDKEIVEEYVKNLVKPHLEAEHAIIDRQETEYRVMIEAQVSKGQRSREDADEMYERAMYNSSRNMADHEALLAAMLEFVDREAYDIYPWKGGLFFQGPVVREMTAQSGIHEGRKQALNGHVSPFVESGYHFRKNLDIVIDQPDGKETRLNSLSFHLFSHGLSEMGEGDKTSDQHYMTLGEYVQQVFPLHKSIEDRAKQWEEEEAMILASRQEREQEQEGAEIRVRARLSKRLIEVAKKWYQENRP